MVLMVLMVVIWIGVMFIGGIGFVLCFLVDCLVVCWLVWIFFYGILMVNIIGVVLLGFLVGLVLLKDVVLLVGMGFVGVYIIFFIWMLEI